MYAFRIYVFKLSNYIKLVTWLSDLERNGTGWRGYTKLKCTLENQKKDTSAFLVHIAYLTLQSTDKHWFKHLYIKLNNVEK